ncbi:MAG: hypothetical protein ACOH5I_18485 [Oligoflexus sp.]
MDKNVPLNRRSFLGKSAGALGVLSLGPSFLAMASSRPFVNYRSLKELGPLGRANSFGMRLPEGVSGRVIAEAGKKVPIESVRSSSSMKKQKKLILAFFNSRDIMPKSKGFPSLFKHFINFYDKVHCYLSLCSDSQVSALASGFC